MMRFRLATLLLACASLPARATDDAWLNARDFGAIGDGVTDDSLALQRALDAGRVTVPVTAGHYRVTRTLRVKYSLRGKDLPWLRMSDADGTEKKTLLEVYAHAGPQLTISGLRLDGGWDGKGRAGEWSHLIAVVGSSRVAIESNTLEASYGDNVFLGSLPVAPFTNSAQVVIRQNEMRSPRRCNVAVVAAHDVLIERNRMQKSNGYVAAIDLEPADDIFMSVSNVRILDNVFDAGRGVFLNIYSPDRRRIAIHDVTVDRNRGRASALVARWPKSGPAKNVTLGTNALTP